MNLPIFWYGTSLNFDSFRGTNHTVSCCFGNYPCGLLWENHSVYAGKILRWPKFGRLWPKFGHFWPKLTVWEFFTYNFQTLLRIFLIFGMEVVLIVFFGKIILYMPGNFWYGKNFLRPKFGHFFGQNWQFWEFLTYNFQTPLWIFLNFCLRWPKFHQIRIFQVYRVKFHQRRP